MGIQGTYSSLGNAAIVSEQLWKNREYCVKLVLCLYLWRYLILTLALFLVAIVPNNVNNFYYKDVSWVKSLKDGILSFVEFIYVQEER